MPLSLDFSCVMLCLTKGFEVFDGHETRGDKGTGRMQKGAEAGVKGLSLGLFSSTPKSPTRKKMRT